MAYGRSMLRSYEGLGTMSQFARFAWANVAYNLLVIMWGAFVRATGSGAGCGDHWPLCDGQVIPRAPDAEQLVEFTHRVTSGFSILGTLILLIWAFRAFPPAHRIRRGAIWSMGFMLVEALFGAALVILSLVETNTSLARAVMIALHLANTFFLLGALGLTAWWASGGRPISLRAHGRLPWLLGVGLGGIVLVGSSGAITALGDTLLQLGALPGGISQPITSGSHPLVQMRALHPVLGLLVGIYTLYLARTVAAQRPEPVVVRLAWGMAGLFLVQCLLGGVNVTLKAPIWMQLVHLLMADLVWLGAILLSATALAVPEDTVVPGRFTTEARRAQRPSMS